MQKIKIELQLNSVLILCSVGLPLDWYYWYTVSVNSNAPHFHTEGLTKKHVHDVDEVCKEDFSPAGCLRA